MENIQERHKEVENCNLIIAHGIKETKKDIKQRAIELAMRDVPNQVKAIKEKALSEVFEKEIQSFDATQQETVLKIIDYFEKKYIKIPMKMAKEIMMKF